MVIATWQATITAIGSGATAVFAFLVVIQIRENRLSRDATITIEMARRWDEPLVRQARGAVNALTPSQIRTAIQNNRASVNDEYIQLTGEANYYEDLAILCRHKAINIDIVRDSWGDGITERWEKWKLAIEWMREPDPDGPRDPEIYENFEWLASKMATPGRPSIWDWLREPIASITID